MGVHRDPEMGPVIMGGSGGVLLELVRDVAVAAPPLNLAKAQDLIARTKAGALMKGYRGSGALDVQAYAQALVTLGRLARDLGTFSNPSTSTPSCCSPRAGWHWTRWWCCARRGHERRAYLPVIA